MVTFGISIFVVILISLATFSFWSLIKQGAADLLAMFGITSMYAQLGLIIIICIIILLVISLLWKKLKITEVLKDILKL